MPPLPQLPEADTAEFFRRLADLYAAMDERYDCTAAAYGFDCRGCADNCCQTRFYHHTHIEKAYLLSAFSRLDPESREAIRQRAGRVVSAGRNEALGADRLMCPANGDGWCLLYAHRPMICRLHGLPHELRVPGRSKTFGPGCAEFERLCGAGAYIAFDRTPFYVEMASLEQAFKAGFGLSGRIRQTVAEMIAGAENELAEETP